MPSLHVVGDSISIHYDPHLAGFLAGKLAYSRKTGAHGDLDVPQGANGGNSGLVLRYLQRCREQGLRWDALAVNCGLHDIRVDLGASHHHVEPETYRANLVAIVAVSQTLADRLVWIRTTPVSEACHNKPGAKFHRYARDQAAYNAIADAVMDAAGVAKLDLEAFTRTLGGDEVFADHVHFTEPVRRLQAAFLAGGLTALLA